MRHRKRGHAIGRGKAHRWSMWRNLATSLLTHGQITTTVTKARSVQPFVEKLITAAKAGNLAARRRVIQRLGGDPFFVRREDDPDIQRNRYGELVRAPRVVKKLFDEIAPRYADRDGGYTRIIKLPTHRVGDATQLCVLQLVGEGEEGPEVSGRYSRRRDKADRRTAFAARLRRGESRSAAQEASGGGGASATAEAPAAEDPAAESSASA